MDTTMTMTAAPKRLETGMYVAVDPVNNNNKFWKYEHFDGLITETNLKGKSETGDLKITWGRVGAPIVDSQMRMYDAKWLASKIKEKLRGKKDGPPYTKCDVMDDAGYGADTMKTSAASFSKEQVKKLAVKEIAGSCLVTAALVKKLAEANRHELVAATGGKMDIDLETGMVRTALGVVTLKSVKEARTLLDTMAPYVTKNRTEDVKFTNTLGDYLRLIPQNVGRKAGWYNTFLNLTAQTQLLDQLETSVELAEQRLQDAITGTNKPTDNTPKPQVFNVKMAVVSEQTLIDRITRMYSISGSRGHESARLRPVRVYSIEIPHMVMAFKSDGEKIGNIKLLWHGTRMFNVLSILKRGFVLPHELSTVQTCGAMYGPGLYFSANSTKSLNYSYGYWDGGRRDSNCYMFLVNVAMGREYIPSFSGNGKKSGYDSCWAKPGQSGVINDEQIVYRTSQASIQYLVEFNDN